MKLGDELTVVEELEEAMRKGYVIERRWSKHDSWQRKYVDGKYFKKDSDNNMWEPYDPRGLDGISGNVKYTIVSRHDLPQEGEINLMELL